MFFDGRQQSGLPETDYDLIIVGAGPAGITLALELESLGLRIALLESGGQEYDDDAQRLNEGRIEGNDDEYDLQFSRLRWLGGTSNHWGGHCAPLDSIDFERSPGGGLSGWPFGRAELEPYYKKAHDYCELGAYRYNAAELVYGDTSGFLLHDNDKVETTVIRQSPPTRFGEKYSDRLEQSANIHVWFWTNVITVRSDDSGEWAETRTLNGVNRRFKGKAVVLAAGAIENTRIVLFSNQQGGTRLGDEGGLLGKCYMDHPSAGAGFIHFNRPVGDLVYWSDSSAHADEGVPLHFVLRLTEAEIAKRNLLNFQYYLVPFADVPQKVRDRWRAAKTGVTSLKNVAKRLLGRDIPVIGTPRTFSDDYCDFIANADAIAAVQAERIFAQPGHKRVLLRFESEERPHRTNFVALDPSERDALGMPRPVLHWATAEDDLAAIRETVQVFGNIVGAAGIGRVQLEDHDDDPYWGTTTAWHQLGCMRMAESPTSGVVDANCRLHGSNAIYVASGAVFPTSGRANPTLTIVALTLRLADHLSERMQG